MNALHELGEGIIKSVLKGDCIANSKICMIIVKGLINIRNGRRTNVKSPF